MIGLVSSGEVKKDRCHRAIEKMHPCVRFAVPLIPKKTEEWRGNVFQSKKNLLNLFL
jgi:hypothetical protein